MDRIGFSWLTDENRTKLRVVPVNLTKESPVVSPLLRRGQKTHNHSYANGCFEAVQKFNCA